MKRLFRFLYLCRLFRRVLRRKGLFLFAFLVLVSSANAGVIIRFTNSSEHTVGLRWSMSIVGGGGSVSQTVDRNIGAGAHYDLFLSGASTGLDWSGVVTVRQDSASIAHSDGNQVGVTIDGSFPIYALPNTETAPVEVWTYYAGGVPVPTPTPEPTPTPPPGEPVDTAQFFPDGLPEGMEHGRFGLYDGDELIAEFEVFAGEDFPIVYVDYEGDAEFLDLRLRAANVEPMPGMDMEFVFYLDGSEDVWARYETPGYAPMTFDPPKITHQPTFHNPPDGNPETHPEGTYTGRVHWTMIDPGTGNVNQPGPSQTYSWHNGSGGGDGQGDYGGGGGLDDGSGNPDGGAGGDPEPSPTPPPDPSPTPQEGITVEGQVAEASDHAKDARDAFLNGLPDWDWNPPQPRNPSSGSGIFTIDFMGQSLNLDPRADENFNAVAAWVRGIVTLILSWTVFAYIKRDAWTFALAGMAAQQTRGADGGAAGGVVSVPVSIAYAIIIIFAMGVCLTLFSTAANVAAPGGIMNLTGNISAAIFRGGGVVGAGVSLLDWVLPLGHAIFCLSLVSYYILFRVPLVVAFFTLVRSLPV